jgi:hypothetical protein
MFIILKVQQSFSEESKICNVIRISQKEQKVGALCIALRNDDVMNNFLNPQNNLSYNDDFCIP